MCHSERSEESVIKIKILHGVYTKRSELFRTTTLRAISPSLEKDMFYVYVLKSEKDNKLYIGYTADLKRRIFEHNTKIEQSTKSRAPFQLIYYEAYLSQKDAKYRESQLKKFSGSYIHLKKRIKNSLILFK